MPNSSDRRDELPAHAGPSPKQDLSSSLELALETAKHEIKLASLLIDVARSARTAGDTPRSEEARARGMAAHRRASQIVNQINHHDDKGSLLDDLNRLQRVLDQLNSP